MKLSRRPPPPVAGVPSRACTAGVSHCRCRCRPCRVPPAALRTATRRSRGTAWCWWPSLFGDRRDLRAARADRGGARTVSLSEAPLVLGLFFTAPAALVLARLVGPLWSSRSSGASRCSSSASTWRAAGRGRDGRRAVPTVLGGGSADRPAQPGSRPMSPCCVAGVVSAVVITLVIAVFQDEFRGSATCPGGSAPAPPCRGHRPRIALVAVNALRRSTRDGLAARGAAA